MKTETMLRICDKREAERIADFTASLDTNTQQRFADFISGMKFAESKMIGRRTNEEDFISGMKFAESKAIGRGATVEHPAAGALVKMG